MLFDLQALLKVRKHKETIVGRFMLIKYYSMLIIISLVSAIVMLLIPAIPQDQNYHVFVDQREMFGIPNFLNVISNVPYFLFGIMGCLLIVKKKTIAIIKPLKYIYLMFFVGVVFVCMGSLYYHLYPDNSTLLWDRLAISLSFMSFFTVIIGEYVHEKIASRLFMPLIMLGLGSVVYWYWSETVGQGDLRLYILIQFLPVILIPIIMWLYTSRFTHNYYFGLIVVCYVLAKCFEMTDQFIFDLTGFVSGHTLKHLISALAPYLFYLGLNRRRIYK